ncbi:MAG: VCBS repeat-containing protein, partial [Ginsengibacter sp.]
DIDFINFVTNGNIQEKIRENNFEGKDLSLINKFPEIKLPNKFFKNDGTLSFIDEAALIAGNIPTFSNGSVYADFDNDGDMDIIVNNIDAPSLLYENMNSQVNKKSSLQINLRGPLNNVNAIGSKIIVYTNNEIRTYEKYPVKGFMSSMEIPIQIGLNKTKIDSIIVVWPDNTYQNVPFSGKPGVSITYSKNLPAFDYKTITGSRKNFSKPMVDITKEVNLNYLHEENQFVEFDREVLIPHMVSTEGPALTVADINNDGLDDVFFGSAENKKSAIFLQQPTGKFIKKEEPALDEDSAYENTDACFADVNNDGAIDLIVASGGNEYYGKDEHNKPRVYLNDGQANFKKLENAFSNIYLTASTVVAADFNGDGYMDLFIGGRTTPGEYGKLPESYLLQNDKTGKFTNVTSRYSGELSNVGFVTQALWFDIDKDGDKDLLLSLEWGNIVAFINDNGRFTKKLLTDKKGWWNFILPCDIDKDGDIDLIAGNLGLNSRLKASEKEPVRLYYNDFDDNGKKEQVLTYYLGGKEIPFDNKAELEKQIPLLKKKFLYAEDFSKATLPELFTSQKLSLASVLTTNYFANALLINNGNLTFTTSQLPMEAQLTSFKDAVIINANNDSLPDILMMGNYYDNNIEMGRYDADFGTILINKNKGVFACETINGLAIKGQVRHIKPVNIGRQQAFILACNNDSAKVIKFAASKNK